MGSHFIDYIFDPSSQIPVQSFVCVVWAEDFKQMGIYVMSNLIARKRIMTHFMKIVIICRAEQKKLPSPERNQLNR